VLYCARDCIFSCMKSIFSNDSFSLHASSHINASATVSSSANKRIPPVCGARLSRPPLWSRAPSPFLEMIHFRARPPPLPSLSTPRPAAGTIPWKLKHNQRQQIYPLSNTHHVLTIPSRAVPHHITRLNAVSMATGPGCSPRYSRLCEAR